MDLLAAIQFAFSSCSLHTVNFTRYPSLLDPCCTMWLAVDLSKCVAGRTRQSLVRASAATFSLLAVITLCFQFSTTMTIWLFFQNSSYCILFLCELSLEARKFVLVVCLCESERKCRSYPSFHPAPLRTCSRLCECIAISLPIPEYTHALFQSRLWASEPTAMTLNSPKPLTPGKHTCSCRPQTYRCLISKSSSPPLPSLLLSLSLSLLPSPFSHYPQPTPPPPPPLTAATLPHDWTRGPLKYLPHGLVCTSKSTFRPPARPEAAVRPVKMSSPCLVGTSKPVTFSYELLENWRALFQKAGDWCYHLCAVKMIP